MKTKKIFLAFSALVISGTVFSQTDSTISKDSTKSINANSTTIQSWPAYKTETTPLLSTATTGTTSSSDISVPKPNHGRYYIPVLGTYQAQDSNTTATTVSITPDENNPGKVWIDGLAETRFYALLKSAPGTYKIPAQKQDEKSVAEGEIKYDESNKSISICVGCGFEKDANTTAEPVVTSTAKNNGSAKAAKKAKSSIISFTGVKTDNGSVSLR